MCQNEEGSSILDCLGSDGLSLLPGPSLLPGHATSFQCDLRPVQLHGDSGDSNGSYLVELHAGEMN